MIICPGKSFISSYNDIANLSFLSRDTLTAIKELAVHIRHMPQNSGNLCLHGIEERFCVSKLFLGLFHLRRRDQIHGICYLSRLFDAGHSFLNHVMIICSCKSFICGDNDIANLSFLSRDTLTAIKELAVHIRHMPQNSGNLCLHGIEERFCVSKLFLGLFHLRRRDQIHGICYLSRLFDAGHSFLNLFCICHSYTRLSSFLEFLCCCKNLLFQFII